MNVLKLKDKILRKHTVSQGAFSIVAYLGEWGALCHAPLWAMA